MAEIAAKKTESLIWDVCRLIPVLTEAEGTQRPRSHDERAQANTHGKRKEKGTRGSKSYQV